ncbi:MAG TPA: hypothetical protein VFX60_19265 [Micromonospora sp.]|nr:hypothetical protein [Micromonospora sp.]
MTTDPNRPLGIAAVAELLGLSPRSMRTTITRAKNTDNPFPAPDGHIGGRRWWHPSRKGEILAWKAARPGPGAGGGRPRTQPARTAAPNPPGVHRGA